MPEVRPGAAAATDREVTKWWARQDSNLRATGYEPGALPLSYGPARGFYRLVGANPRQATRRRFVGNAEGARPAAAAAVAVY